MENRFDTDPSFTPVPVRLARPLIHAYLDSRFCPPEHRWHARSTLPVLALFVAMSEEPTSAGLAWDALSPDALMRASLDADPHEHAFLRDLLDASASFYAFLGAHGHVAPSHARDVSARLTQLAMALGKAA